MSSWNLKAVRLNGPDNELVPVYLDTKLAGFAERKTGKFFELPAQQSGDDTARRAMDTPLQKRISAALPDLKKLPQVDCPLVHRFTPGLYTREIFMPAGTLIVSKIHKTEHQFIIVKGKVSVFIEGEGDGVKTFTAPHVGITKAGTRRVLLIHDDCAWLTAHATDKTTPEEVEADIIYDQETDESLKIDDAIINQLKEGK